LLLETGNNTHDFIDNGGALVLFASNLIVILEDNDTDETKLLEVNQASSNAVKLNIRKRPLYFDKSCTPVDGIED
jgi:hypothetical protein